MIEAVGFDAKPAAFTERQVIDALRADAADRGRAPYQREWLHRPAHLPGAGAVVGHFGSWTDGLHAAGLRSPQEKNRWTPAATLDAARRDAAGRGRPPRAQEWPRSTDAHPSAAIAERRFGSWNEMLIAAGLPTIKRAAPTSELLARRETQMIRALKLAAAELGAEFPRPAYQARARRRGWPSHSRSADTLGRGRRRAAPQA